jgi:hypothetical protein
MTTSLRNAVAYALTIPPHSTSVRSAVAYALTRDPGVAPAPSYVSSDLRKAQDRLLYDLIEDSNPGFQAAFPLNKIQFGAPAVKTIDPADPYKRDTTCIVSPKQGSGLVGSKTISYRRIDVGSLFRNMVVQIQTYYASTTLPKTIWQAEVNSRFGIVTLPADWNNISSGIAANTVYTGTTLSGLCYKGTLTLQWVPGKRPASDLIPDAKVALVGRTYPAGNDFTTPGRKPVGEWQVYGVDFSPQGAANLEPNSAVTAFAAGFTSAGMTSLLNFLNANTGRTNWSNKDSTIDGGICGLTWYKYTIPSASVPEANSARFNRVMVIQGVAGSWFSGKILLHYNV